MNPVTQRLEPVMPEKPTPTHWEQLEIGQEVTATIGGQLKARFKVDRIQGQRVTLRIIEKTEPDKRWALRKLPYNVPVVIGTMRFRKMGATNKTIKIIAHGATDAE